MAVTRTNVMTHEAALCKLYGMTHMLIVIIFTLPNSQRHTFYGSDNRHPQVHTHPHI